MLHSSLHIDVMLTEAALADEFVTALAGRFLPELFFYWSPLSVRAWLSLCRDGPYRNYVRSDALMRTGIPRILEMLPDGRIDVVSLGAGQGTKDRHLLTALTEGRRAVTYIPVDSGQALLEMACEGAAACGVPHRGVKADIANPAHLSALAPESNAPTRLIMVIGNTVGAFDPPAMLGRLRPLLREGDVLLIDGELGMDPDTRTGYENPTNRAFALAPLRSLGISEADGTLVFDARLNVSPGIHRLDKYFRVDADLTLNVGGESLKFTTGERIRMNHSGKYEYEAFHRMVSDAGFESAAEWLSEDRRFVMMLAKPSALG